MKLIFIAAIAIPLMSAFCGCEWFTCTFVGFVIILIGFGANITETQLDG